MAVWYLKGRPWSDWTRDERFFCSALYSHAAKDVSRFAAVISVAAGFTLPESDSWDLGYEVSFYRDFLWQQKLRPSDFEVSDQRAFDLCLFGEQSLVIIEAKVFEPFSASQNRVFELDKVKLNTLPGLEEVSVRLVALASSRYFANQKEHGRDGTLGMFDGRVTWAQLYEEYGDPLLAQADRTYRIKQGEAIS
jgi:hypothetical protein